MFTVGVVSSARGKGWDVWLLDSEPNGTVGISPPSPQVSLDIPSDAGDVRSRHANIATIVKNKDLDSLIKFGGVPGIAEALHTDLEKGIPGDEQDLNFRRSANPISKTEPSPTFFQCLLKACNSYIIFLLLLSMALYLGFGIKKEGLETGWYEGFIILVAIIIIVVCHSIRDFWRETQHRSSGKHELSEKMETVVEVLRGGSQKKLSSTSDIVLGDILCIKRGYLVPADGLLVPGEALELDVGMNTEWGEMMRKVIQAPNKTPLQAQLDKVNTWTEIFGLLISILIIVVLFLRLTLENEDDKPGLPSLKGKPSTIKDLMDAVKRIIVKPTGQLSMLITSLNMLLVGVIEGYPCYHRFTRIWNKKALSGNALVKELSACAILGSATAICTDKIGGLTTSTVQVKTCRIGGEDINGDSVIHPDVIDALCYGIYALVLDQENPCGLEEEEVVSWAKSRLGMKQDILKQGCTFVGAEELNSNEEGSQVLLRKTRGNETVECLHWKGPARTILTQCSSYYDSEGKTKDMGEKRMDFENFIQQMQSKNLKTMAFAYKEINDSSEENSLILIGLLSLRDTDWAETKEAVQACRNAGVNIKMVSSDNISELRDIAVQCGMSDPNSLVLDGNAFRNYTKEERMDRVDRISIMGNALPSDKLLLVECLKQKGHTVAVIGARTDETPAIRQADVGVTMGTWSTKMAKETSDIVIFDGNFSVLVTIMRHGRCAYENVQKYMQHELTMVIAGLLVTFITMGHSGDAPITAIQLAFGSVIVGIPGGLALLTEPPAEKLIGKQPVGQGGKLMTWAMWRNIITQASYQVFNLFNCRKLEKKNMFQGIKKNLWFWVAVVVIMGLQAAFIEIEHWVGGSARLNCVQWGTCLLIGMVSWVIDCIGKFASDLITHCIGSISRYTWSLPRHNQERLLKKKEVNCRCTEEVKLFDSFIFESYSSCQQRRRVLGTAS
ncbi:Calcium-transporting ATPase 12, plasma membrane-type [Vitis vinifera]|uniref:Calcium-transporting ATPase 12, plasma membrane-type n=1 Tax=Vitis vinifera TaxID=29760 RepID=A0A438DDP8_VITVI|nr:Calcium-transporting ATPase 12, plasma membrane-type [Vitis vinifera]